MKIFIIIGALTIMSAAGKAGPHCDEAQEYINQHFKMMRATAAAKHSDDSELQLIMSIFTMVNDIKKTIQSGNENKCLEELENLTRKWQYYSKTYGLDYPT